MTYSHLQSKYDFYRMAEKERKLLVGTSFTTNDSNAIFFPVDLSDKEINNYNRPQGLIFVTPIYSYGEHDGEAWFRVGACSPDDLWYNLDIVGLNGNLQTKRDDVIFLLTNLDLVNLTYKNILEFLQNEVGGEIDG